MPVNNIIFDLGAVIIDIDYHRTADAFRQLGLIHFDDIYSKKKQSDFFDRFEKGELAEEEFLKEIKSHLPGAISADQIINAWNAMLIGIPAERYSWLESLRKHKRIFLLSNTNHIHVKAFSKMIDADYGIKKFESLFEKVYYSCCIGMRKPDREIFDKVISDNHLDLSQTIFIDDSPQHIEGARKAGLISHHLPDNVRVEELVATILNG
jgi:glucose-1-phosphatase